MNCVASTYNASGKLIGCTEQELNSIISVQLYTVFALGTGFYFCRSFTADNWADIAITIGWGCISALTHTKRAFAKHVLPCITVGVNWVVSNAYKKIATEEDEDDDSTVIDDDHSCIRVVKDGNETLYSSIFIFVQDLDEHFTSRIRSDSEVGDGDVINVQLSESVESANESANESATESISELISRIENHTMDFDFILSEVCTLQTIMNSLETKRAKYEGMHVMKYNGFPIDKNDGMHFYDRTFIPVDHRMMEIVLQYNGKEYDLNLASPDNFYVAGNKLLDLAFLKWFMLKNHGVRLVPNQDGGIKCDYTIKCVDHAAVLHTLHPHNYLHVSIAGFEVQDSGLV